MALVFGTCDGEPILDPRSLGQVVAGEALGPTRVALVNLTGVLVGPAQVTMLNPPPGHVVEISTTLDPFMPEDPMEFPGTFADGETIGQIWVRATPPITAAGTVQFSLKARALLA